MTLDQIEAMSDAEFRRLPAKKRAACMKVILDSLVTDGLAYQGPDGRYRMREDARHIGDGLVFAGKPN